MRTSWSRAATQEEEEKEEEKREKEEAPSQQAAERGSRCVGQIPSSRLPPAGCGQGEDPTGCARLLPDLGVALEQGTGCPTAGGAALRAGQRPHRGTRDGVGHMAAFPGRNRSVPCLDNTEIVNFWSGWEAEGSGAGDELWVRGWARMGLEWGWGAGNAHSAGPCSWHCFGLCSAPPKPRLLLSSDGCRGTDAVPIPGPLSHQGAPVCGEGEDEGAHPSPPSPSLSQCWSVL